MIKKPDGFKLTDLTKMKDPFRQFIISYLSSNIKFYERKDMVMVLISVEERK